MNADADAAIEFRVGEPPSVRVAGYTDDAQTLRLLDWVLSDDEAADLFRRAVELAERDQDAA